jgi:3-hydroxybutyryl-CoA dehydrogenase
MKVTVISDENLKAELLAQSNGDLYEVIWETSIPGMKESGCMVDLLFDDTDERISQLSALNYDCLILNSVINTTNELPENCTRINGWSTLLSRPVVEAATGYDKQKDYVEKAFSLFSKTVEWVPDIPGFIVSRVVSMIINEAYYTLEDGVTGKEEIDTAMKLGTRYPYGPFEWGNNIGLKNISNLLEKLSAENKRYEPAALLKREAFS